MKKNLLMIASLLIGGFAFAQEETTVTIDMKPAYADQVYYKFVTNKQTPVAAASWDLAFENVAGQMDMGTIRINDGKALQLFKTSAVAADYATVDVATQTAWTELFNSYTDWSEGAFDQGGADYGWGNYNGVSHVVEGATVYVLKSGAAAAPVYTKIFITDYTLGKFNYKFATWDATTSTWGADQAGSVTNNATATTTFNYVSLATNAAVTVAPADADWDLVFRKYIAPVANGATTVMYSVTGALQNSNVTIAQTTQAADATVTLPVAADYSADINTIGDDWKTFSGTAYSVAANNTFYIKDVAGKIYRAYFTAFSGSAAGTATFNYKDVTSTAGLTDVNKNLSFGLYPNPTATKNVTLLYDLKNNATDNNVVTVYSLSGAKVYETKITNNSGFYNKELNLSSLSSGMYIVKLTAGNATATQKLVIQ